MRNRVWFTLNLLLLLAILSFSGARAMPVVQTSGLASNSFGVSPTFTLANCETTVVPGFTTFCPVGTGQIYYCLASVNCATSTAGWVQVGGAQGPAGPVGATGPQGPAGPPGVSGSITINGVTKTPPATFQLITGATTITAQ